MSQSSERRLIQKFQNFDTSSNEHVGDCYRRIIWIMTLRIECQHPLKIFEIINWRNPPYFCWSRSTFNDKRRSSVIPQLNREQMIGYNSLKDSSSEIRFPIAKWWATLLFRGTFLVRDTFSKVQNDQRHYWSVTFSIDLNFVPINDTETHIILSYFYTRLWIRRYFHDKPLLVCGKKNVCHICVPWKQ